LKGKLLLRTGQLAFESEGLFAWYNVMVCTGKAPAKIRPPRIIPMVKGVIRRYYIGVVEGDWDYCPDKIDPITGETLFNPDK
jgi:hypothetical protein